MVKTCSMIAANQESWPHHHPHGEIHFQSLHKRPWLEDHMDQAFQKNRVRYRARHKRSATRPRWSLRRAAESSEVDGLAPRSIQKPTDDVWRSIGKHRCPILRSGPTEAEKQSQISRLRTFQKTHAAHSDEALKRVQQAAINNENIFEQLMEAVRYCSLGQISDALYEVGGQYRRNM